MIVEELVAVLGFDVKGEAELRRFNDGLNRAHERATALAASLIRVGAVAGAAAATGLAALGKSVISTSAQFETYAATLETIEGSSAKAQAALDWISDFAKRTPFEVAELTEAFVRLRAYGMDPTSGLMESLGDASSAMGKSLMQAVEMIADASTGEFERLKEFGIRASQEGDKVTFSWTENGKALTKTVQKNGAEITKFIQEQFGNRFNGAMIRQSKTWNGMMSNLGDSWENFKLRIGQGGFFEAVKARLGRLLDWIDQKDKDGSLTRWSDNLGWAFESLLQGAEFVASRVIKHFNYISSALPNFETNPEFWQWLQRGLIAVGAIVFPKTAAIIVLEDILSWMQGSESFIGAFAESLSQLTGIDVDTLGTIIATLAGGAALTLAAGGITAITAPIMALTGALRALGGRGAAAGLAVLGRLGLVGAAGMGVDALVDPSEQLKNAPRSGTWGVDDVLRWMLGTGGESAPAEPSPYAAAAAAARQQANQNNPLQALEDRLNNARGNMARMGDASASGAVVNDNKQDNRNQSTTVNVGGVTVQGVQNAGLGVGSAVGRAVGNSAAAGAARVSRFERDDAF